MHIKPDAFATLSNHKSLPEELAAVLRQRIASGEFVSGDVLPPEQLLADTFNVSRTVVREALARLKYEGLILSKRGRGPIVQAPDSDLDSFRLPAEPEDTLSPEELKYFIEFRMIMEGEAAALAALRRTPKQLRELEAYLGQMRQALVEKTPGTEPDYLFHCLIADCVGNAHLGQFARFLSTKIWLGVYRARWLSNQEPEKADIVLAEHSAIFESIQAGDPHQARAAAQRHMFNSAARQGIMLDSRVLCRH